MPQQQPDPLGGEVALVAVDGDVCLVDGLLVVAGDDVVGQPQPEARLVVAFRASVNVEIRYEKLSTGCVNSLDSLSNTSRDVVGLTSIWQVPSSCLGDRQL